MAVMLMMKCNPDSFVPLTPDSLSLAGGDKCQPTGGGGGRVFAHYVHVSKVNNLLRRCMASGSVAEQKSMQSCSKNAATQGVESH